MPSMFHAVLVKFVPFPVKTLCWPLLLDPVITLSVNTPGVCCRIPHGSRELGIVFNSSCVKFVPARSLCVSSSGTSELTVTAADTPDTLIGIVSSVLPATRTSTLERSTVVNPDSSALIE